MILTKPTMLVNAASFWKLKPADRIADSMDPLRLSKAVNSSTSLVKKKAAF